VSCLPYSTKASIGKAVLRPIERPRCRFLGSLCAIGSIIGVGLGHMTLVISEKKFPPMCCGPKCVIPKLYRTCGLTALRDLTKASQSLKINLDRGLSEGV